MRDTPDTGPLDPDGPERKGPESAVGSTPGASLGSSLGPALWEACGDRLGHIEWFSTPWQRSGSATARTWWRLPSGDVIQAIAKVPVNYREWRWTTALGAADPMMWDRAEERCRPVPRVLAGGLELGGYDMAWLVIEAVTGQTIARVLEQSAEQPTRAAGAVVALCGAAAAFHKEAIDLATPAARDRDSDPDWSRLIARSNEACEVNPIGRQRDWIAALKGIEPLMPGLIARWSGRGHETWCHGDLHPGNAILRPSARADGTPCVALIDLGLIHAGHWIEDALYIERLHWGRPERLGGVEPLLELAAAREALGLENGDDWRELAGVRRVLMAATSPAFLNHEHDARYLEAALRIISEYHPEAPGWPG